MTQSFEPESWPPRPVSSSERSLPDPLEAQLEAERVSGSEELERSGPIQTRTMAELFVQQVSMGQAIEIFRHLVSLDPDDTSLRARLAELEDQGKTPLTSSEEAVDDGPTIGLYFQSLLEFEPDTDPVES